MKTFMICTRVWNQSLRQRLTCGEILWNITTSQLRQQNGVFANKEPSQEKMDSVDDKWKDSMDDYNVMLVTIGRSSTENGTYLPGVDGVDASQNLNQTDPLGVK